MRIRLQHLGIIQLLAVGCAPTGHPVAPSPLGRPVPLGEVEAALATPGVVSLEKVVSADWAVPREGLINLEHDKARAAGLSDGDEPIQVAFYAVRHPTQGLFIVDTGVENAILDDDASAFQGLVRSFMNMDAMRVRTPLGVWLAAQDVPLRGVFLTHLHLDHMTGLPDVPRDVPVSAGPGETAHADAMNIFVRGLFDSVLEGRPPLREWPFASDAVGEAVDVFGDGSFVALRVPGHTPGNTAYLARTPQGPVLLTGDTCHTRWGWENEVEPGTFSVDQAQSAVSLRWLKALAARHPGLTIHLGHQALTPEG